MRRYRHRLSEDVDIFIGDPQYLTAFSPRLNDVAEGLTSNYAEDARFLKLYFDEGEVDFIVGRFLTDQPVVQERILGSNVLVETPREIVAKKVFHRGSEFRGRDLFDFALVIEKEPQALRAITPILAGKRDAVLERLAKHRPAMLQEFNALDVLDYRRSFDECELLVRGFLSEIPV